MGLASVWAEYGPARNERARGQNSIYIEGSSPSQTLRIRTIHSHIQFSEKYFLRSVRGILIKPVSSRGHSGEDLEILRSFVLCRSSSIPHQEDIPWIPNQVHNIHILSIKIMLCVLTW